MASRRVPNIPQPSASNLAPSVMALALVVKHVTGQSQTPIEPLAADATLVQVIDKLNELIARLQGSG